MFPLTLSNWCLVRFIGRARKDAVPSPVPGGLSPVPGGPSPVPGGPSPVPGGPSPVPGGLSPVPGGPSSEASPGETLTLPNSSR